MDDSHSNYSDHSDSSEKTVPGTMVPSVSRDKNARSDSGGHERAIKLSLVTSGLAVIFAMASFAFGILSMKRLANTMENRIKVLSRAIDQERNHSDLQEKINESMGLIQKETADAIQSAKRELMESQEQEMAELKAQLQTKPHRTPASKKPVKLHRKKQHIIR